jgi:hypothetical protein
MAPIRLQTALVGCLAAAFLVFTFITFRSEFQREISSIRASIEEWQHPVRNTRDDLERQDIDLDLLRFEHRSLLYLMGLNRIARGKMRTPRPYENCRLRMELYKDGKKIAEHRDGDWLGNEGCKFRNVLVQSLAVKEPDGAVSALVAARVSSSGGESGRACRRLFSCRTRSSKARNLRRPGSSADSAGETFSRRTATSRNRCFSSRSFTTS